LPVLCLCYSSPLSTRWSFGADPVGLFLRFFDQAFYATRFFTSHACPPHAVVFFFSVSLPHFSEHLGFLKFFVSPIGNLTRIPPPYSLRDAPPPPCFPFLPVIYMILSARFVSVDILCVGHMSPVSIFLFFFFVNFTPFLLRVSLRLSSQNSHARQQSSFVLFFSH